MQAYVSTPLEVVSAHEDNLPPFDIPISEWKFWATPRPTDSTLSMDTVLRRHFSNTFYTTKRKTERDLSETGYLVAITRYGSEANIQKTFRMVGDAFKAWCKNNPAKIDAYRQAAKDLGISDPENGLLSHWIVFVPESTWPEGDPRHMIGEQISGEKAREYLASYSQPMLWHRNSQIARMKEAGLGHYFSFTNEPWKSEAAKQRSHNNEDEDGLDVADHDSDRSQQSVATPTPAYGTKRRKASHPASRLRSTRKVRLTQGEENRSDNDDDHPFETNDMERGMDSVRLAKCDKDGAYKKLIDYMIQDGSFKHLDLRLVAPFYLAANKCKGISRKIPIGIRLDNHVVVLPQEFIQPVQQFILQKVISQGSSKPTYYTPLGTILRVLGIDFYASRVEELDAGVLDVASEQVKYEHWVWVNAQVAVNQEASRALVASLTWFQVDGHELIDWMALPDGQLDLLKESVSATVAAEILGMHSAG